jgi:hypothetical protein
VRRCALLSFRAHSEHILNTGTSDVSADEPALVKALVHRSSLQVQRLGRQDPSLWMAVIFVTRNGYRQRTTLPASHGLINFALSTIPFVTVAFLDLSD